MDTLTKDKAEATARAASEKAATPEKLGEIDELMRIKQARKFDAKSVPCPCCNVMVEITINRCPFCDSDIAPETALARETMRRLRELSGEIDADHGKRLKAEEAPKRRGFFERLKYLFEGDPVVNPNETKKIDPFAKRMLENQSPGDSIKVLAEDGPWLLVKTMGGETGWVYCTIRKR